MQLDFKKSCHMTGSEHFLTIIEKQEFSKYGVCDEKSRIPWNFIQNDF